jgi:hypothetical protein
MGKIVSAAGRAAKIAGMAALIGVSLAQARGMAAPPASSAVPPNVVTDLAADRSAKLPMLSDERTAAVQLLWFDPLDALPAGAEEALAEEVRSIFRGLGVEVAFRTAGPGNNSFFAMQAVAFPCTSGSFGRTYPERSGRAQYVAGFARQMGDDRKVGAGGGVGLTTALFPSLQRCERNSVSAGECLLR